MVLLNTYISEFDEIGDMLQDGRQFEKKFTHTENETGYLMIIKRPC